jgi:beta-lactam-binding protein with PASTA domain
MYARRMVIAVLVVTALLVTGCTAVGCGIAVPDVKGKTASQAETALTAAGLALGKVSYDEAAEGAAGAVVAQDPAGGAQAQKGAVVNLTVAGPPPVTVPSLIGLSKDAAASVLAAGGLILGNTTQSSSETAPLGAVISQTPAASSVTPRESAVAVVLSSGPKQVAVPAVTGKAFTDASAILVAAGFQASTGQKADAAAAGTVLAQSPDAGALAAPGSTVALTVSTGTPPAPAHVKVPSVKGQKLAAAKSKIEAAGLKWKHVTGPGDGMSAAGYVYKQAPAAGVAVDAGSEVVITTWNGP